MTNDEAVYYAGLAYDERPAKGYEAECEICGKWIDIPNWFDHTRSPYSFFCCTRKQAHNARVDRPAQEEPEK